MIYKSEGDEFKLLVKKAIARGFLEFASSVNQKEDISYDNEDVDCFLRNELIIDLNARSNKGNPEYGITDLGNNVLRHIYLYRL